MNEQQALDKMVAPSTRRPNAWLGGVVQILWTNACDLSCNGCTQGSNLAGKPSMITPEELHVALRSLEGYWGVVGTFGGNPAIHPKFEELCDILCQYFPYHQRGIWCNNPKGHGKLMRTVFNPNVSNLNVHCNAQAFMEFKKDWPGSHPFGLDDVRHSPTFKAIKDVEPDEAKRWEMISNCDVNREWSAWIGSIPGRGLRAYFCEVAGAQAAKHGTNWPDAGCDVFPGWWKMRMQAFASQVKQHCHACGMPLKEAGNLAVSDNIDILSPTHAGICKQKDTNRLVELQSTYGNQHVRRTTDYVGNL